MNFVDRLICKLPLRVACLSLIILPSLLLVFHALIIADVLPRNIVWGGRLTDQNLLPLEALAVALNLLLMTTGAVAGQFIRSKSAALLVDWTKWFLFYFVVFNSIAGPFSATTFEVWLTPITVLYALCLYRINRFSDGLGTRKFDPNPKFER